MFASLLMTILGGSLAYSGHRLHCESKQLHSMNKLYHANDAKVVSTKKASCEYELTEVPSKEYDYSLYESGPSLLSDEPSQDEKRGPVVYPLME